jgi:calcineurin-like phosphoesterase family protein
MRFFTSDTHFGHANIIKHCSRPFSTVGEMDSALVAAWNSRVGPSDEVYHLGDFGLFRGKNGLARMAEVAYSLNGKIHLIRGNHDPDAAEVLLSSFKFVAVRDLLEIKIDSLPIVLCHYPLERWNRKHYGAAHLHGHCHGRLVSPGIRRFDVGVDTHHYFAPYSEDEIAALIRALPNHQ